MAHPTPHPATTDLKPLPVPPLDGTLDAYSHALEAVLDGSELVHARGVVESFRTGAGPRLDAQLRERASQREAAGINWLNDEWYSSYLSTRPPLTLASNVGFQIAFPASGGVTAASSAATSPADLDRAVEFIRRAATVHLAAAADALPEDVDARGNRITSRSRCSSGSAGCRTRRRCRRWPRTSSGTRSRARTTSPGWS